MMRACYLQVYKESRNKHWRRKKKLSVKLKSKLQATIFPPFTLFLLTPTFSFTSFHLFSVWAACQTWLLLCTLWFSLWYSAVFVCVCVCLHLACYCFDSKTFIQFFLPIIVCMCWFKRTGMSCRLFVRDVQRAIQLVLPWTLWCDEHVSKYQHHRPWKLLQAVGE